MRRILSLIALTALATVSSLASAQTAGSSSPKIVLKGLSYQSSCPIAFSAQRYGLTATLRETANGPVNEYGQSLRLRFDPKRTSAIERMYVRVYGMAGTAQVIPVGIGPAHEAVSNPMELTSKGGQFDPVQYIASSTLPVVTRIEITEIVYRDGTKAQETGCFATPSLFVPVMAEATAP